MLQEIDLTQLQTQVETIQLTQAAADAVRNILTDRKLDGYALRVYVAGSGCCGTQFGMALDNNFRSSDETFEQHGVKVVVDDMSIEYLRGARIDFVNDPQRGAGFLVDSPSAAMGGSCACGSKSSHGEEGDSCGCGGGSCGCGGH